MVFLKAMLIINEATLTCLVRAIEIHERLHVSGLPQEELVRIRQDVFSYQGEINRKEVLCGVKTDVTGFSSFKRRARV